MSFIARLTLIVFISGQPLAAVGGSLAQCQQLFDSTTNLAVTKQNSTESQLHSRLQSIIEKTDQQGIRDLLNKKLYAEAAIEAKKIMPYNAGQNLYKDIEAFIAAVLQTKTPWIIKNPKESSAESFVAIFDDGLKAIWKPHPTKRFKEVFAYQLAKDLGLDMVPVTVLRQIDGRDGSLQAFTQDDHSIINFSDLQFQKLKVLDVLLSNPDRLILARGNYLTYRSEVVAIDHDMAFDLNYDKYFQQLISEASLKELPRSLEILKNTLTENYIDENYKQFLDPQQMQMFMQKRLIILNNSL